MLHTCNIYLGFTSPLNILGHIATVFTCRSCAMTNVLPHKNAMPQTQDMTPHPVTVYRHPTDCRCAIHRHGTLHWNTQLPILMSWVRPDREILPRRSPHTPANAQLYDNDIVNVSQKLDRKFTMPTGSGVSEFILRNWCYQNMPKCKLDGFSTE